MSKMLIGFRISLIFLFFVDFHIEAHPVVAPCYHCVDFLKFQKVTHPFEHLARDKPLDVFCTNVTDFSKCIENCFDPTAPPDFLLAGHTGWLFAGIANLINVTEAVCTNGTQLREDYLMHSHCFRNVYNRTNSMCENHSVNTYLDYFDPQLKLFDSSDELQMRRIDCVTASTFIGCLGFAIHEECGDNALDTFKELIELFGFFKMGLCSTETLQIIRTSFIDSLRIDESKKSFYRECIV